MNKRDILLNKLAQGLRPMTEGIEWFDGLGPEEQSEVLLFLRHHCVQARAVTEDAPESIHRAGLRPTWLCSRGWAADVHHFGRRRSTPGIRTPSESLAVVRGGGWHLPALR
ncbi:DUF5958 family protein [Streptomyces gobitricini]|uniref:Uncharacterized protein n=1 Tax=Streptomyces gobitricini TaxID=68211 RepID=A0ABP5YRE8_9ACTN